MISNMNRVIKSLSIAPIDFSETTLNHLSNLDVYSVYIYYWVRRAISRSLIVDTEAMSLIWTWSRTLVEFVHNIFYRHSPSSADSRRVTKGM